MRLLVIPTAPSLAHLTQSKQRKSILELMRVSVIAEAENLVEKLGGLPIALDQAGAYIKARKMGFAEYHDLLERHFKNVAARGIGVSVSWYRQGAFYSTWEISYQDLKERCPIALEILLLCVFLDNVKIPEELLYRGLGYGISSILPP